MQSGSKAKIPTKFGDFYIQVYPESDSIHHLVLTHGHINIKEQIPVRIHSKCLTGEVFGSLRCDCQPQLVESMRILSDNGSGLIIYLDQEGRGIGIHDKIRAYALQDATGIDTIDANLEVGQPVDLRRYDLAIDVLRTMKIQRICLLTNNPDKIDGLVNAGFIVERVPLVAGINPNNIRYLETKKHRLNHLIPVDVESSDSAHRHFVM